MVGRGCAFLKRHCYFITFCFLLAWGGKAAWCRLIFSDFGRLSRAGSWNGDRQGRFCRRWQGQTTLDLTFHETPLLGSLYFGCDLTAFHTDASVGLVGAVPGFSNPFPLPGYNCRRDLASFGKQSYIPSWLLGEGWSFRKLAKFL